MRNLLSSIILAFGSLTNLSAVEAPRTEIKMEKGASVVIIGGGIGALTSALYLGRAGLEPIVIEGATPGGLLTQSHSVQNWPGELEIEGFELTDRVRKQVEANGAIFRQEEVIAVDFSKRPFTITTRALDNPDKINTIQAEACIIAMGTQPNFLNIPGETGPNGYWGRGVTNCAICDGSLYKDQVVGVVGGGDAAVLEALYLSNIAKEVHVFVRKDKLRAFEEKRIETLLEKSNVTMHYNTVVKEVVGDEKKVTHVLLQKGEGEPYSSSLDGLFLAIGSKPNSTLFQNVLKMDEKGYILLAKDQQTSVAGVYAIGDIVDPVYKQAISAAGDGAKAALQAQQFVSDRTNGLIAKKKPALPKKETFTADVIEILSQEQFNEELSGELPIVVDFYASWCGPCKRISPIIESSATQLSGKVKFLKVNVDKVLELSKTYDIKAMPTVLVLDSTGTVVERKVGTEQIVHLLKQLRAEQGTVE